MKSRRLDTGGDKTCAVILERGDEVASALRRFAKSADLSAARFNAIGAFSDVAPGYFDWEKKDYVRIPVHEQVEVLEESPRHLAR